MASRKSHFSSTVPEREVATTAKGMIGYSDEESHDLEAFVGLRRRVLAPTSLTATKAWRCQPFEGLPQSTRPCLTAGGGASQLPTWLVRPRHQVWLRSAPCEACLPAPASRETCAPNADRLP